MREQKGITLISLTTSIVVLIIFTAALISMSNFFFANQKNITDASRNVAEFNKFNMYFIEDVKNNTTTISVTDSEIIFGDGTVYTFRGEPDFGIYRNKVKICENVSFCRFDQSTKIDKNTTKKIVLVRFVVTGEELYDTLNEYVLRYW